MSIVATSLSSKFWKRPAVHGTSIILYGPNMKFALQQLLRMLFLWSNGGNVSIDPT